MVLRRSLALLVVLLAIGAAACGDADPPTQVSAGGDPVASATSQPNASSSTVAPTTATTVVTSTTTAPVASEDPVATSTTVAPVSGPAAPSPVDGLDASELQAALAIPAGSTVRSAAGPTVDQVTLADGTRVWRVRIPGDFDARSARVAIRVGDRTIGEGVLAPDLSSITAVTTDGRGLAAGRPVIYQWEGGPSVAAGNLVVAR